MNKTPLRNQTEETPSAAGNTKTAPADAVMTAKKQDQRKSLLKILVIGLLISIMIIFGSMHMITK